MKPRRKASKLAKYMQESLEAAPAPFDAIRVTEGPILDGTQRFEEGSTVAVPTAPEGGPGQEEKSCQCLVLETA